MDNHLVIDLFKNRGMIDEALGQDMLNEVEQSGKDLTEILAPHGVAVVMEGKHLCMMMRGVQKQESSMITSAMRGTFREDARTRNEFLDLMR